MRETEFKKQKLLAELFGGKKVSKDDPRIVVCGIIDEANSALGLARTFTKNDVVSKIIYQIQQELLLAGSECACIPGCLDKLRGRITAHNVNQLKRLIDKIERETKPAKGFVIPGDSPSSATLHLARTIVRRAERAAVKLRRKGQISKDVFTYLDQLSDSLFSLARFEACTHTASPLEDSTSKEDET